MTSTTQSHRVEGPPKAARDRPAANGFALVARQPIYGAALTVSAYELLYRDAGSARPAARDAREATLRVVADAALEIGLDRLAAGVPVHIHYPRELLTGDLPLSVQPERVVIEVVEDSPADAALLAGLRALRMRGHRIAVDGYSPRVNNPQLLELADFVKIDVAQESRDTLAQIAPGLVRRGLQLIAEDVSTVEQFDYCVELGFEGFQGDFLQRPETFIAQRVPSNRLAMVRLIAALQDENYSVDDIERMVAQDLSISYRVLRSINSSFYNLPRKVDSIRHAIVILGLDNLRQLCTLVALQGFEHRPPNLFVTALVRARMCEQLARAAGTKDIGVHFITGLFSLLDVLTGIPMAEVLDELPLTESAKRALIAEEGAAGAALRCARAYERALWDRAAYADLTADLIRAAYVDAVFWAEQASVSITR